MILTLRLHFGHDDCNSLELIVPVGICPSVRVLDWFGWWRVNVQFEPLTIVFVLMSTNSDLFGHCLLPIDSYTTIFTRTVLIFAVPLVAC